MNWVTLVVFSSLVAAGCNILDKWLMDDRMAPPSAAAISFGVAGLPVALVGLMCLPPTPWPVAVQGLAAGTLFIAAAWLYYDTMGREEVSRLVPLLRLSTVQTLILGWLFLGEALSPREWTAFAAMVVGSLLLTLKPGDRGLTFSWEALRMVPVTTLLAANQVLMAPVYRVAGLWAGVTWENLGIILAGGLLVVWHWARGKAFLLTETDRRIGGLLVLEQAVRLVTGLAPAWAVAHGVPVALVSAASGMRLAWVWLLAAVILRERVERRDLLFKGGGIAGIGFGVYWLG